MLRIVLISLFVFVSKCADTEPFIQLKLYGSNNTTGYYAVASLSDSKVENGKKFSIIIDKSNITGKPAKLFKLRTISCNGPQNREIYSYKWKKDDKISYTQSITAAATMEGTWKCVINEKNEKIKISTSFNVKFKKSDLIVFGNDNNISLEDAKTYDPFDQQGVYEYRDGEMTRFVCWSTTSQYLNMTLMVPSSNGADEEKTWGLTHAVENITTEVVIANESKIYVKLTDQYNGTSLNCSVIYTNAKFTVRVLLIMQEPYNDDVPKLKINGVNMIPYQDKHFNYVYYYEYYDGEQVSIFSLPNEKYKSWNCSTSIRRGDKETILKDFDKINESTYFAGNTEYETKCRPTNEITAILKVGPTPKFDYAYLGGLSLSQTRIKYQENSNVYHSVYDNFDNDNLTLSCSTTKQVSKMSCDWKYDGKVIRKESIMPTHVAVFSRLTNVSKTSITCQCNDEESKSLYIADILYYPEEKQQTSLITSTDKGWTATEIESNQFSFNDGSNNNVSSPSQQHVNDSDESNMLILVGTIAVTIIVIVGVTCLVVGIYKRKRKSELAAASDVNYESLPAHNEGPMPIPTQWTDYCRPADFLPQDDTYCVPHEKLYAEPVPKSKRNQPKASEPLYAEAMQTEPNYAVVASTGWPNNEYVNLDLSESPYAEVQPVDYTQVLPRSQPNADNYARVLPKSLRKPDAKYSNTFENQRYANLQNSTSDYAEPAYCELSNTIK